MKSCNSSVMVELVKKRLFTINPCPESQPTFYIFGPQLDELFNQFSFWGFQISCIRTSKRLSKQNIKIIFVIFCKIFKSVMANSVTNTLNLNVQCCIKISKYQCKFVAMVVKGRLNFKKLFDFLEMPTAAHIKCW